MRPFRFGIQLAVAGSGGEWRSAAASAEEHGYDVLLAPDHFGQQLSPIPGLTAAASATTTLRVGTLVACNDFRHPLMLAKEAATLDLLSDGRFELGIGAGWDAADYHGIGIAFDPPGQRANRLAEAVELIKKAWTGAPFSFQGEHYSVTRYEGRPLPVQRPRPPLLIGSGARWLLGFAAREADIVAIAPRPLRDGSGLVWGDISAEAAERKCKWVREGAPGRSSIEISCNVIMVEITDDPNSAIDRLAARIGCPPGLVAESPHVWVGAIDEIVGQLLRRRERFGISYYTIRGDRDLLETSAPIVGALAGR